MAAIRSFTSLEQSRKLAEILPLESADMKILPFTEREYRIVPINDIAVCGRDDEIYAWSLAALLNVLPAECECMSLEHINYGNNHKKYFMSYIGGENTDTYDNPVDACVAMIEKLNKLNML